MIFGFFKKGKKEEAAEEVEIEPVRFLGAINGKDANLAANQKLVDAGLVPTKDLVTDALARRADTIRIEPKGPQAIVTLLIDGVPYPGGKLPKLEGNAVVQMLKLLGGLDIKQRKASQSGGIKAEFDNKQYQLMLSVAPVAEGERLTIRANDQSLKLDTPADLGISDEFKLKLRNAAQNHGLFAAVGPASSGTTTTLYAVLRGLDAYTNQIFTMCDTGGRKLNNIGPPNFEINPADDLATTLTRAIRVEANVLFLAPIKDADTVKTLLDKGEDVALMTEFAAKDTASGVAQLIEWSGDAQLVSQRLNGLITQKLLRKLCPDCKQAYRPKPEFLKKAGIPATENTTLYRKPPATEDPNVEPCEKCNAVGFLGRIAMFEFLEMTDEMRALVATKPDAAAIRAQMKKEKMLTLQQDGLRLVAEGKTSLEELQRVFKTPAT